MRRMGREAPGRRPSGGFTLLEVLVSLAVFSIVAAALYAALVVSNRAAGEGDDALVKLHELRAAMDVMGREVEASLCGGGRGYRMRVRDRDFFGKQASSFEFVTFMSQLPGAASVTYRVEESGGGLVLVKSLSSAVSSEGEPREAEFVEDVESFLVEARVGGGWTRNWESDRLPEEVRIEVSVSFRGRRLALSETLRPRMETRI